MKEVKQTGYSLSSSWFDFIAVNRDKNFMGLGGLVFWIIQKANKLNFPKNFGLPTDEAMHLLGIGTYPAYKKQLIRLEEIGFIKIIELSKNQYTSNVIAISNFDKAPTKQEQSTNKAYIEAPTKQEEYNKLKELKETKKDNKYPSFDEFKEYALEKQKDLGFNIDLDKLKTKFIAWSENDWKNGYGKKIKNWKSTLTNSLTYLKANDNAGVKTNKPVDYKMQQHLEHDKNVRNQVKNQQKPFLYGSQMRQLKKND
jgi:hypothetical protein